MKFVAFLAIAACVLFFANAVPKRAFNVKFAENDVPAFDFAQFEEHTRQKRATCDLLSGLGVNNSACAAHCILRGNRGGYCDSQAVCVCRN